MEQMIVLLSQTDRDISTRDDYMSEYAFFFFIFFSQSSILLAAESILIILFIIE